MKPTKIQQTSLMAYYHSDAMETAFREQTKRKIIMLLELHNNLTDREMCDKLGYLDPNKVRPRRHELANKQYTDPPVIIEDYKRNCSVTGKVSIAWRLNKNALLFWLRK